MSEHDAINHPSHYTSHPSGLECITFSRWLGFCVGNAFKYVWRCALKGAEAEDLGKALWYLNHAVATPRVVPCRPHADLPGQLHRDFQRFVKSDTGPMHWALQRMWNCQFHSNPVAELSCARNIIRTAVDKIGTSA